MRRLPLAVAVAITVLLGLNAAPSLARSPTSIPAVGDRLDLSLGDQSFPASTPFNIAHGIGFGSTDNTIGLDTLVLDLDGTPLTADFVRWFSIHGDGTVVEYWYWNFPDGLTGTHEFTRHYFGPCDNISVPCDGNRINTPVEFLTLSAVVTFTP